MARVLKWIGIVVGGFLVLVAGFLAVTAVMNNAKLNRSIEVSVTAPQVPTDAASIAEGSRLTISRGCTECHGADLAGKLAIDDPVMGTLWSTNLTPGQGGVGSSYDAEDFARAIWYGVRPDGSPLVLMPSAEYHEAFDAAHLGKIIAYLQSLPPVDRETPPVRFGPLGWTGNALGFIPLTPVDHIDLNSPPPDEIQIAATPEYGATIGVICTGCHGPDLAGFSDPGTGVAPNLTPHESGLAGWEQEDLVRVLREGTRPDGTMVSDDMPWRSTAHLTDVELSALWAYLQTLDPLPSAVE